jgi:hypothetical protein
MSIGGIGSGGIWYQVDQAWSRSRAAINQQFLAESATLTSALSDAMSNQISGSATLAAQAALKRIKGKTTALSGATGSTGTTAATTTTSTAGATTASSAGRSSTSASQYTYTSAASILSANSNVVNLFA